jgi:hypothetical protein
MIPANLPTQTTEIGTPTVLETRFKIKGDSTRADQRHSKKLSMTKQDILRTLEDNGFCHGRILPKGQTPQAELPNRIVPNAALVTPRHGIVWRGGLELTCEGQKLQWLARKTNQNLYVVDEASAAACQAGPPRHLIRHAIWWTCIHETEEDLFGGIGIYHQWHRKGRGLKLLSPDPPGKNWAGKLVLADECPDQQQWQQEVSTEPGRQVKPVLLQRSGRYELVWFDHGNGNQSSAKRCSNTPVPSRIAIVPRKPPKPWS